MSSPGDGAPATIVIVGGGYAGAILALKLARSRPHDRVKLVERRRRAAVGLAYGACDPGHLLNVPVSRMESGLSPTFETWLGGCGGDLSEATDESGGALRDAFVPRALFGRYMEQAFAGALSPDPDRGLQRIRGEAVRILDPPRRGVVLDDAREVEGDLVILATGNMPPHPAPTGRLRAASTGAEVVEDPWSADALEGLDPDAPVLLVGAGLTMVDIALRLAWTGHRGPITAVSRHGRPPQRHVAGGAWDGFLATAAPPTPLAAFRLVRAQVDRAREAGVPWQRVFDAARPDVARVWRSWSLPSRSRFLRHLRSLWDSHRHRMAPRVADRLDELLRDGRLTLLAGRVAGVEPAPEGGARVRLKLRGGHEATVGPVARILNCTGPRSDFDALETPLYGALRRAGLVQADELGLGLATQRCAVIGVDGEPSPWLYAVGGLTRPSLWEVTAVPEINAQIDALTARMSEQPTSPLDLVFSDLGAGI